ncbi:MAG: ferritin-like domain-containing protein [Bryobacteraceae bacterium]
MKISSLHDLYVQELRDLYHAENQLIKALPKMVRAAGAAELRSALEEHLQATRQQVERLERIFQKLDESPKGAKCKGMEGIIGEGEQKMDGDAPERVRDAALISSVQRVEHYEIAAYGTVRTYAQQLGYGDHAELLQQTLNEEGQADRKLTQIAESRVNMEANRTA